ncbi:MAG: antibiotic biosynthesis monooxygenase [Flavobacteriaceae bacterium]|nr:antibiotic biosynthesis monooxygenase [Flavobacteriaceae bacterium]
MINRIVKLTLKADKIEEFKKIFSENKKAISSFEGCIYLEILQDIDNENVFFTYSHWQEAKYLEMYRNSDLFIGIWSKVKPFFSDKAQAWSLTQINNKNV